MATKFSAIHPIYIHMHTHIIIQLIGIDPAYIQSFNRTAENPAYNLAALHYHPNANTMAARNDIQ